MNREGAHATTTTRALLQNACSAAARSGRRSILARCAAAAVRSFASEDFGSAP